MHITVGMLSRKHNEKRRGEGKRVRSKNQRSEREHRMVWCQRSPGKEPRSV